MSLTFSQTQGNGVNVNYPIVVQGGYFTDEDILVEFVNVETKIVSEVPDTMYIISNGSVIFNEAPSSDVYVRIRREVTLEDTYSDFTSGNSFGEDNMNRSFLQALYQTQQLADGFKQDDYYEKDNLNLGDNRITNLQDGVDEQDAVTMSQLALVDPTVLDGVVFTSTQETELQEAYDHITEDGTSHSAVSSHLADTDNPHNVSADDVNCLSKTNTTPYVPTLGYHPATRAYVIDYVTSAIEGVDVNADDFLSKTNETPYTPTTDYHPSTKKYVDDTVAEASLDVIGEALSTYNGSILDAITAIGVTETVLIIDQTPDALVAYTEVPTNITIDWKPGFVLSGSYDFVVKGNLIAGYYKLFNSTVTATFNGTGSVYPEWFGAIGNQITDDHDAIQSAFYSEAGMVVGRPGAKYLSGGQLLIPSNFIWNGNGATLVRGYQGSGVTNEFITNTAGRTTYDNHDITLINLKIRQNSTSDAGNILQLIGADRVTIYGLNIVTIAEFSGIGGWACYLSGEDIVLDNIYIDARSHYTWGDGVHLSYVKNFSMQNFVIHGGDDAISLFYQSASWATAGANLTSENINIGNGVVSSQMANGITLGAAAVIDPGGEDAGNNCYFKNVLFHDININGVGDGSYSITIRDRRAVGAMTGKHDNIRYSNIVISETTKNSVIYLAGNDDIDDVGNIGNGNFGSVTFDCIKYNHTGSGSDVYMYGVDKLSFNNCSAIRSNASPTGSQFQLQKIEELIFNNCDISINTLSTIGLQLKHIDKTTINSCDLVGTASLYAAIQVSVDANLTPDFYMSGGSIRTASRSIHTEGTGSYGDFIIKSVDIDDTSITLTEPSGTRVKIGEDIPTIVAGPEFSADHDTYGGIIGAGGYASLYGGLKWTENFDINGNFYDGKFTAPADGIYEFNGLMSFTGLDTSVTLVVVYLVQEYAAGGSKNHTLAYTKGGNIVHYGNLSMPYGKMIQMSEDDEVYLYVYADGMSDNLGGIYETTTFEGKRLS